ncbi:toxin biosynthesis regulatory protein [Grosmannia clavigera kw1407]|uniref:Toxin biosynthesis regulatory protein n=1 Tax=Grosmannia clavigera (strain kw1407 / UAMH 11150) TaxID=655863 RepID=F0XGI8_GROCL|nr:toxin biosynthesis regulatory protein [Grosmannia clavigera kw1407]EFX02983.1 toxin biosynthesis regulatory protein [Grosmannia clavigera kw1407]
MASGTRQERDDITMNAHTLDELQTQSDKLAAAVRVLGYNLHSQEAFSSEATGDILSETKANIAKAKADILAGLEGIRALLDGPDEFLSRLTIQVQILACLKWLSDFQILACIPREGSLPISDLADLAGVPEDQLRRVIRLTAGCRFLREVQPNCVSHTELSGQFLARQPLCDATNFIANTVAPAALHMNTATRLAMASIDTDGGMSTKQPRSRSHSEHHPAGQTAYDIALRPMQSFHAALQEPSKLARQWTAYLTHAAHLHSEDELINAFLRLQWPSLGNTCIVEVLVQVTDRNTLACIQERSSGDELHHINGKNRDSDQNSNATESNADTRTKVTLRQVGSLQPVTTATVYILHLPPSSSAISLLPAPGSLDGHWGLEAAVRVRDLSMLQLANEGEMEMAELLDIVESVTDNDGKLVVASELRSHDGLVLALVLKHKYHG